MKKRELGKTGIEVSEVGFGAWQLGSSNDWGTMSDEEAIYLIHMAIDSGCNFFDTAPNYGSGTSEQILGKALVGKRKDVVINTKFGHTTDGKKDFRPMMLRQSIEESLKRLQTDYVDTILLHNPPFEELNGTSPLYEILDELKKEGKIRAYGASVDSSKEMKEIIQRTNSQVIEVLYNIFHQEPAQMFPEAKEKGIGIITKVPLDSGWLSGKYDAKSRFEGIRSRWASEDIERRFELLNKISFITEGGISMVQAALGFILSHQEISTVIPGVKNTQQLQENISANEIRLDEEKMHRLREIWEQELMANPLPW
jgi:aryl-alcohol dehydrogenase-like predicted oxidoreductase